MPHLQKSTPELEIKDAQVIFRTTWEGLVEELGIDKLRFPKELILLGGAPGSGKGTHTRFISKLRGLTCDPIVVSGLLNTPRAKAIKDAGGMVGDKEVVDILFRELLKPEYLDGVILDGFPRTTVQVECLKMLTHEMNALWRKHHNTHLSTQFRKPTVHVVILFVEEAVSVKRQIQRGKENLKHNEDVRETGVGRLREVRATDLEEDTTRRRYKVFKEQTWSALTSLKERFFYHFINAQGNISEVAKNIERELQYQSSLELDPTTFNMMREIPLAQQIVVHARQELVHRLDAYAMDQPILFKEVLDFIDQKLMPIVKRHAITGKAFINSENHLLDSHEVMSMLIDIFSERGFRAVVDLHRIEIPEHFDIETGKITCREKKVYRIQVRFLGSEIRRG